MARSSSNFFESSSIQSTDERIEASQFSMAILERETSAQIGGGANMRIVRRSFLSARFKVTVFSRLTTETTGGGDSSSILANKWPQKRSQSPKLKKFPWGSCPLTPLVCSHLSVPHVSPQWPYCSIIAGSGPESACMLMTPGIGRNASWQWLTH